MKYALNPGPRLAGEAALEKAKAVTIEENARRCTAPRRFLEHTPLDLRSWGVITSTLGRSGEGTLIKRSSEISISKLVRAIDGSIASLACLSRRAHQRCDHCTDEATQRDSKVFAAVFWPYPASIDSQTVKDMLRASAAKNHENDV